MRASRTAHRIRAGEALSGAGDRSTLGAPSKYTPCFAEDESDPDWEPLSVSQGVGAGRDAVTLFQGDGLTGVMDQGSRTPEGLARSLAASLLAVGHTKLCEWAPAVVVLSPEHYRRVPDPTTCSRARVCTTSCLFSSMPA
jgi:hypothetical protein